MGEAMTVNTPGVDVKGIGGPEGWHNETTAFHGPIDQV
jgi:hypothetical protein